MPYNNSWQISAIILLGCLVLISGCTETFNPADEVARVNSNNLQRLANLYSAYQADHDWRGPANEKEFKAFISGVNPATLNRIGVEPSQLDKLFVSDRDGQPFKIRFSVPGSAMGSVEPVIFEAVGVDGKKMVGFLSMEQREVDSAEYDSLFAKGAASPAPVRQ